MSGISVKVVILGDSGIGKTCLIQRYISGRSDIQNTTLGAVFVKLEHNFKNHQGKNYHLPIQFWDTAGQERYNALIPMYIRDADYVIIAFDLTNLASFQNLDKWLSFGKDTIKPAKFVLVGCKNDLSRNPYITDKLIEEFRKKNMPQSKFFKCSSMTNENIDELFLHIKISLERLGEQRINLNSIEYNNNNTVSIDDYNNLFSGNSYVDLVGVKKKCCF
tara:strand:+ start:24 stop:680 length:657 start_codon:yes stop_codon:yes gene_type:complete